MTYERILYEVDDRVATITLNLPDKRNALRVPMVAEIGEALHRAERDDGVGAVILTGAGEHFCAGGDMAGSGAPITTDSAFARMQLGSRVAGQLLEFPKPLVSAVDGVAFGAGFSFAIAADLLIATHRARFCMAFMRMGLVPDAAALFTLPRLVGTQRARELIYTTRELDAATARDWGLVLEVVEPAALRERSLEIARAMATHSPAAFALTKAALLRTHGSDPGTMLEHEIRGQTIAFNTDYARRLAERFRNREGPLFRWPEAGGERTVPPR